MVVTAALRTCPSDAYPNEFLLRTSKGKLARWIWTFRKEKCSRLLRSRVFEGLRMDKARGRPRAGDVVLRSHRRPPQQHRLRLIPRRQRAAPRKMFLQQGDDAARSFVSEVVDVCEQEYVRIQLGEVELRNFGNIRREGPCLRRPVWFTSKRSAPLVLDSRLSIHDGLSLVAGW
jgi:hypothetical protein